MGGVCGTFGGKENLMHNFGWRILQEGRHVEDLGVDGRIIVK